jgi:hypothetical protein
VRKSIHEEEAVGSVREERRMDGEPSERRAVACSWGVVMVVFLFLCDYDGCAWADVAWTLVVNTNSYVL